MAPPFRDEKQKQVMNRRYSVNLFIKLNLFQELFIPSRILQTCLCRLESLDLLEVVAIIFLLLIL